MLLFDVRLVNGLLERQEIEIKVFLKSVADEFIDGVGFFFFCLFGLFFLFVSYRYCIFLHSSPKPTPDK